MVVDFGNVARVYNNLENKLKEYVETGSGYTDIVEDVNDLVNVGNLYPIENLTPKQLESTLRYLVETTTNFDLIEDDYDATVLFTILMEYKMEWLNGTPIFSKTWGGFVSSYENMFVH